MIQKPMTASEAKVYSEKLKNEIIEKELEKLPPSLETCIKYAEGSIASITVHEEARKVICSKLEELEYKILRVSKCVSIHNNVTIKFTWDNVDIKTPPPTTEYIRTSKHPMLILLGKLFCRKDYV